MSIYEGKICPYCGAKTEYTDSSCVYGTSYGMIYICHPCKAWVGVHKGTDKALGRLANASLRKAKMDAHKYFDQIWRSGRMSRSLAYAKLAAFMNIDIEDCHIGMFDEDQCSAVEDFSRMILETIG